MHSERENVILSAKEISKSFGGLSVLKDISIEVQKGHVLALVGENGAGKSTLINIMSGLLQPDGGELYYENQEITWSTPEKALRRGVAVVHQELTLFKNLPIYENIFAGNPEHIRGCRMDRGAMRRISVELMEKLGLKLDPNLLVEELTMAQQQIVEIVKAIAWKPKLLILDEATSALDTVQVQKLFACCRELLEQGTAIIFVSHRMTELFEFADQALVIKDGFPVGYYDDLENVTENDLVNCMVGYAVETIYPEKNQNETREPLLVTDKLTTKNIENVSIQVRPGEIIGLGGLRGHGQEELLRALFGLERVRGGEITLDGKPYTVKNVEHAIQSGIAYVPPDRKTDGLVLTLPIEENLTISILHKLSNLIGQIYNRKETDFQNEVRNRLRIDQRRFRQLAGHLSGGNQQKVVIGKWLKSDFKILLMDEPTRGVDVATKHEIYAFLRELVAQGVSVLLVSTEIMELMGISDRVYIFYEGKVHAELCGKDINEEKVTYAIMGL